MGTFWGPPKSSPGGFRTLTITRCGWLMRGIKGWRAQQIKAAVKVVAVCLCAYMQEGGHRFWLRGGGNMCRRFDLWGSEHDNYYLPSKKLTTALRTSKHLCPFYYIIKEQPWMAPSDINSRTSLRPKTRCAQDYGAAQTSAFAQNVGPFFVFLWMLWCN